MGDDNRFSTPKELEEMKRMLKESLEAGCVGFSTGLMYYPGMYAHTDELVALARVAAEFKRPYASHLRGYCTTLPNSMAEAVTIAREAKVRVQISHLHAVPFFGSAAPFIPPMVSLFEAVNSVIPMPGFPNPVLGKGIALIDEAVDEGLDIGMDALPYTLGNTTVTVLFPPWANRGGRARLLERLKDPETRARMERDIKTIVPRWPHWEEGSWSDPYIRAIGYRPIRVLSVKGDKNRWAEGKTFIEIADRWKTDPFSALCRLTLEEDGEASFVFGFPARPWVEKMFNTMLVHPRMSIGADSILPVVGTPPPSAYGCFPRVLGHYCRKLKLFTLEEAIRKITSLPAETYGLTGRGVLRKGAFADITVFDPKTVDEVFDERRPPRPRRRDRPRLHQRGAGRRRGETTGEVPPGACPQGVGKQASEDRVNGIKTGLPALSRAGPRNFDRMVLSAPQYPGLFARLALEDPVDENLVRDDHRHPRQRDDRHDLERKQRRRCVSDRYRERRVAGGRDEVGKWVAATMIQRPTSAADDSQKGARSFRFLTEEPIPLIPRSASTAPAI